MSIFSRLKKPASVEPKPADAAPKNRGGDGASAPPSPAAAPEPAPAPKNGAPSVAKPASPPAPPAKANGVITTKAVVPAAAPAAAVKQPELSRTMLYGAVPASARAPAQISTPVAVSEPAKGSMELAIDMALEAAPSAAVAHGTSTDSDQAALRGTFEDLAVPYMSEIRSVMLELQWGEVQSSWLELARPVLRSLRKMAEPVGNTALVEALDRFDAAIAEVLAPGQPPAPSPAAREALLAAYAPLRTCLPRAFELDGERDRREPLIVRALLEQVPGLEPLMIETLMAAGFGKLSLLYAARADEIAAVSGIPDTIAAALAARIQAFRRATPAGLASIDTAETLRALGRLLETMRTQHAAFEEIARSWSDKDRSAKRQLRRERQLSLLQITIELVRLGEVDLAQRLDKLPFAKKIDEIDRLVSLALLSAKPSHRPEARASGGSAAAT